MSKIQSRMWRLFVCLVMAAALAAPAFGDALPLADGVVVDGDRGLAYVMSPRGGIEAIDLASGAVAWRSEKGARPLAVVGERLLTQNEPGVRGRGLALATLRLDRGGAFERGFAAPLPAHVTASVVDHRGGTFRLTPAASGSEVLLRWTATIFPSRGALWSEKDGNAAARVEEGVVRIDPAAGRAVAMSAAEAAAWNGAVQAGALRELARGAGGERRFRSVDDRHEVASASRLGDDGRPRFTWSLSEVATGRELSGIEMSRALLPFLVAAGRLLVVAPPEGRAANGRMEQEPQRLSAYDESAATELWTVALRDVRYHGPVPP